MGECTPPEPEIPAQCTSWFDGCNICTVQDGKVAGCTKRFCEKLDTPECRAYDYCLNVECNEGETCVEERKMCITSPCPQYACRTTTTTPSTTTTSSTPKLIDHCAAHTCSRGETCKPSPKACLTTPCPQYECMTAGRTPNAGEVTIEGRWLAKNILARHVDADALATAAQRLLRAALRAIGASETVVNSATVSLTFVVDTAQGATLVYRVHLASEDAQAISAATAILDDADALAGETGMGVVMLGAASASHGTASSDDDGDSDNDSTAATTAAIVAAAAGVALLALIIVVVARRRRTTADLTMASDGTVAQGFTNPVYEVNYLEIGESSHSGDALVRQ
jgi:hypothetical protein